MLTVYLVGLFPALLFFGSLMHTEQRGNVSNQEWLAVGISVVTWPIFLPILLGDRLAHV